MFIGFLEGVMDLRRRMERQGLFQGGIDRLFALAAPRMPAAIAAGKQIHQHGRAAPLGGLPNAGDVATKSDRGGVG